MPSQSLRSENQSRTESREPGSKRMIDVEFDERKIGKVRGWFEHWTACRRKVPNFFGMCDVKAGGSGRNHVRDAPPDR